MAACREVVFSSCCLTIWQVAAGWFLVRRSIETPTGAFTFHEADGKISRGTWETGGADISELLLEAERQLNAYFAGQLQVFDLPLAPDVSPVGARFLAALQAIPFGQPCSYGQLAAELGISAQAAGQLCGANPIAIVIPCHRVLAANSLGGFSGAGGVETKVQLLRHEGAAGLLI